MGSTCRSFSPRRTSGRPSRTSGSHQLDRGQGQRRPMRGRHASLEEAPPDRAVEVFLNLDMRQRCRRLRQRRRREHLDQLPVRRQPLVENGQDHAGMLAHRPGEQRIARGVASVRTCEHHIEGDGPGARLVEAADELGVDRAGPRPRPKGVETSLVDRDDHHLARGGPAVAGEHPVVDEQVDPLEPVDVAGPSRNQRDGDGQDARRQRPPGRLCSRSGAAGSCWPIAPARAGPRLASTGPAGA